MKKLPWRIVRKHSDGSKQPDISWLTRHFIRTGKIPEGTLVGAAAAMTAELLGTTQKNGAMRHGHIRGSGL